MTVVQRFYFLHHAILRDRAASLTTPVELMPQYQAGALSVHAVYASRKHITPKVRLMIDFLVEWFRHERWPGD